MIGRTAIARILMVIILIAMAHAIKPFSVKNISSHLLYSLRSLAFILPDSMRSSFDQTNQLALNLSESLFSGQSSAMAEATAKKPDAFADITPEDLAAASEAAAKKAKVSQKRKLKSTPVALPAVMPRSVEGGVTPAMRYRFLQFTPLRIRLIYEPKQSDCEKIKKKIEMIALFEETRKQLKNDRAKVEWSAYKVKDCEEAAKDLRQEYYPPESEEPLSEVQDDSEHLTQLNDCCPQP